MSKLDEICKFKIGDFVKFPGPVGIMTSRALFRIIERIVQECFGGVQIHYKVRSHERLRTETIQVLEMELEEWTKEDSEEHMRFSEESAFKSFKKGMEYLREGS